MQVKTYLGTVGLKCAGVESSARYLVVAESETAAAGALDATAAMYWCEPEDSQARDEGWYFFPEMDAWAQAGGLTPIGLGTFWDLRDTLPVRSTVPADKVPTPDALANAFDAAAKPLTLALKGKGVDVSHSVVLHALASAVGETNWHALRTKVSSLNAEVDTLRELAWSVVNSCDNAGCDESLTVADADAVAHLWQKLTASR